jgi:hypothetical protein
VRDVREPMTDNFHVGDRTAKGHGSGSALATGGCDVRDVREPMTDKPHVGDPATVGTTTDKVTTATRRVAHEARPATAVASSRTGDDATLTHLLRDAREALTTAGYKAHEARAAVEIARSEFDDDVTLPLLIRKALQCCARARTA